MLNKMEQPHVGIFAYDLSAIKCHTTIANVCI